MRANDGWQLVMEVLEENPEMIDVLGNLRRNDVGRVSQQSLNEIKHAIDVLSPSRHVASGFGTFAGMDDEVERGRRSAYRRDENDDELEEDSPVRVDQGTHRSLHVYSSLRGLEDEVADLDDMES
eukprot:gene5566-6752_t